KRAVSPALERARSREPEAAARVIPFSSDAALTAAAGRLGRARLTANRPDNAPERLGSWPGFDEWSAEVVSTVERRRAASASATLNERKRQRSRIGRAWR